MLRAFSRRMLKFEIYRRMPKFEFSSSKQKFLSTKHFGLSRWTNGFFNNTKINKQYVSMICHLRKNKQSVKVSKIDYSSVLSAKNSISSRNTYIHFVKGTQNDLTMFKIQNTVKHNKSYFEIGYATCISNFLFVCCIWSSTNIISHLISCFRDVNAFPFTFVSCDKSFRLPFEEGDGFGTGRNNLKIRTISFICIFP